MRQNALIAVIALMFAQCPAFQEQRNNLVQLKEIIDYSKLPAHIAIIMDGNGRWAKKKGLLRIFGHRAGVETVKKIVEYCTEIKIKVLTLYAFSTENWVRPQKEINGLMGLLQNYLRSELGRLQKNNIRLRLIGDISKLPTGARAELRKAIRLTQKNTGLILNLALNYGSRQEIVSAVNLAIAKKSRKLSEADIAEELYTFGLPDPDLLIRTSGEKRLSNFLLWQMAYTELYFTDVLWPDFAPKLLNEAIIDYQKRNRRFGGI